MKKEQLAHLYRVNAKRVMHIPGTHNQHTAWASPGDILCIDHPVLQKYAEGQYGKMTKLEGLPKGAEVHVKIPQRIQREVEAFDRRKDSGTKANGLPAVGRPSRELENKVKTLESENSELKDRISALEKAKAPKAESGKDPF